MTLTPDQLAVIVTCERVGVKLPAKKIGRPRKECTTKKEATRRRAWRAYYHRKIGKVIP